MYQSMKHHSFLYTHLNDQTVLFQTILFSISIQFFFYLHTIKYENSYVSRNSVYHKFKYQTLLLDPQIGSYEVLPLRAMVDLAEMAIKGYSAFAKALALLKPRHQSFYCHI